MPRKTTPHQPPKTSAAAAPVVARSQPYEELAISYELRDASRVLLRAIQTLIAPHRVTLNQFFLLRQLWERDGVSQREISDRMQTSEPATVAAIDGLEKRGYVKRVREGRDRRVVSIYVTPKGTALRDTLLGYARMLNDRGTAGMTRAEKSGLQSLLFRFKKNVERYEAGIAGIEQAG